MAESWTEYINKRALELAACETDTKVKNKLTEIENDLQGYNNVPNDFWKRLTYDFDRSHKVRQMRKDAASSRIMHEFENYVDQQLADRIKAEQAKANP